MSSHLNNTGLDYEQESVYVTNNDTDFETFYLQKLRNVYFQNTNGSDGLILNTQDWEVLISMFLSNRLISIEDERRLQQIKPSFPMDFDTLVNTIA